MRTVEHGSAEHSEFIEELNKANGDFGATIYGFCEFNRNAIEDCLEGIDNLLKSHDLEIVIIDDGSTDYVFKIEPVSLAAKLAKKLDDPDLSKDYTIDDFFDEVGISKEHRSDFGHASILKQAEELRATNKKGGN